MDCLDISSYLNNEIDILNEELLQTKKRRASYCKMFGDNSIKFRRENFQYKFILKKINKLGELLNILELIKVVRSSEFENRKYKRNTIFLYYSLIDLLEKNSFDFNSATAYLKGEIKKLIAKKSECKLEKDRINCNKNINYYKSLVDIISKCNDTFKTQNTDDIIEYLLRSIEHIEGLDCDGIRYMRFANFDKKVLSKYVMLADNGAHNFLYDNLFGLSYDSLEDTSQIANSFLVQYGKLQSYCNEQVTSDLKIPLHIKEQIDDAFGNKPIKNLQLSSLCNYLSNLIDQQQCLIADFNDKFSFDKITALRGKMSVNIIENTYFDLLYTYKDGFSQDFRVEKCKNMDEYLETSISDDPYYNVSSHKLYRLSTDYQEIRKYAISYLREYAKKYCALGVTSDDLDLILLNDDIDFTTVQKRLKEVNNRIINNNKKLQEYYKMVQNYFNDYNCKISQFMSEINCIYDDFFFVTHSSIDVDVATNLCNMNNIIDGLASSYQQYVFNNKFVLPNPVKNLKK